jgi:hypothetical protein
MAGLVPAIHDLSSGTKNVDARDKPGHDDVAASAQNSIYTLSLRHEEPPHSHIQFSP